jgi:hypothetical protein
MVGPLMNVPAQTLEGLILKQRIGQTLEHYADDAADDLSKLVKGYKLHAAPLNRPASVNWHKPPLGFMASPAIEPFGFTIVSEGLRIELERLHGIAMAEFQRRTEGLCKDMSEAEARERVAAIRAELFLSPLTAGIDPDSDGAKALAALDRSSDAKALLQKIDLFDRNLSREAFEYAHALDLSPVTFNNLLRLHELFASAADTFSDWAQEDQFRIKYSGCYDNTAGGVDIDAEQNRIACLRDACMDELQRRKPKTESERDEALIVRVTHEMRCEGKIRDRSLIAEIGKAWGG